MTLVVTDLFLTLVPRLIWSKRIFCWLFPLWWYTLQNQISPFFFSQLLSIAKLLYWVSFPYTLKCTWHKLRRLRDRSQIILSDTQLQLHLVTQQRSVNTRILHPTRQRLTINSTPSLRLLKCFYQFSSCYSSKSPQSITRLPGLMTHREKEATHPLENYLPLTYGSNQPTLHGWISIPSSVHKWHKNSAVVYACCVFEILSCCVRVSEKVCRQYRVTEKLHVAFKLLDGISCPVSLQALSRKCPLTYQPILSLQLFRQL